jgi:hypothetical protein
MQQLAERGLPAWEALARATGKSKAELMELGAEGKLMSDEYLPKLIDGLGKMRKGAMLDQSKTLLGMFSTMKDEIKAFSQEVTSGAFGRIKFAFQMFVQQMNEMKNNETLIKLKENITTTFNGMANVIIFFTQTIAPLVVGVFSKIFGWLADNMPAIQSAVNGVTRAIAEMIKIIAGAVGIVFNALANAIGLIIQNANWLIPTITILTSAVLGGIAAFKLYTFWVGVAPTVISVLYGAITLLRSGMMLQFITTNLVTAAQWAWNTAIMANPIVAIVVGIGALIAALIAAIYWIHKKTNFFKYMFEYIKTAVQQTGNILKLWLMMIKNNFLMLSAGFLWLVEKIAWGMNKVGLLSDDAYKSIKKTSDDVTKAMKENQKQIVKTQAEIRGAYAQTTKEVKKNAAEQKKAQKEIEDAEKKKETAAEDAFEAEQKKQEAISKTIQLAKAGVKEALTDLRNFAKQGHSTAIEAMASLDAEFTKRLQANNKKSIQSMVSQLKALKEMYSMGPIKTPVAPKRTDYFNDIAFMDAMTEYNRKMAHYNMLKTGSDIMEIKNLENKIAKMQGVIDETDRILSGVDNKMSSTGSSGASTSTSGGSKSSGDKPDSAQKKAFDEGMAMIQRKKDFNKMSMNEEMSAYTRIQQKMNRGTKEGNDFWFELEKKKFDLAKEMEAKKKELADKEVEAKQQAEEKKKQAIEDSFNHEVSKIERKKEFQQLSLQQEFDAYDALQKSLNTSTKFGAEKSLEIDKKKFALKIAIEKEQYDASIKNIENLKAKNQLSFQEELAAYTRMQSKINQSTKEGKDLFAELEQKKLQVVEEVSQKIYTDAQKRIARMAKLSSDGTKTEITELEKLLAKSEIIGDERAQIESDLWDKKVDYAKEASDKILEKTLDDIEKAKDADIKAIEDVYDAKRKQIEDIFKEQEKSEDKQKKLDELKKLREQESIFSTATSKRGKEQLAKIREDIQNLMDDMKKDANEQLKDEMISAIDEEEEAAKKKAEARADALAKEAEAKAKQVESSLINIATKTGNSMQTLVDTINGYQGSFYKAGAGLIEQFGLGLDKFEPKAEKLKATIEKIKNAKSAMDIDKNLAFGSQIAQGIGSERMLQPMNNSNNKTTNYNAPLINIQAVNIKDKVDAQAWAKESAGYLELATRKMGR